MRVNHQSGRLGLQLGARAGCQPRLKRWSRPLTNHYRVIHAPNPSQTQNESAGRDAFLREGQAGSPSSSGEGLVRRATYRPFYRQFAYFSSALNEDTRRLPSLFPPNLQGNFGFVLTGSGVPPPLRRNHGCRHPRPPSVGHRSGLHAEEIRAGCFLRGDAGTRGHRFRG
ncbi:type ISP restriction/modification enzyme [Janibacter limosus]|uniref:type ISP restriction/modification enzyme n=1 Tax=Janibacter limosus TaxID=53458 RepID=UPI0035E1436F